MDYFKMSSSGGSQAIAALAHHAAAAEDMSARLLEASDHIYEATRHRFDTEGEGEWPPLQEATVAKKESQGYSDPPRILYAEGNLYESATSPNGPYSQRIQIDAPGHREIIMLVDWDSDGWQIASVLAEGNARGLPPRPIWPWPDQVQDEVAAILMRGL